MAGCVEGKVAVVTGGASGIGRATALTFAREGTKLIVADLNADGGQQTVHMITEKGGEAIFVRTDVSQAVDVQALISQAVETYGRLDCAHNKTSWWTIRHGYVSCKCGHGQCVGHPIGSLPGMAYSPLSDRQGE